MTSPRLGNFTLAQMLLHYALRSTVDPESMSVATRDQNAWLAENLPTSDEEKEELIFSVSHISGSVKGRTGHPPPVIDTLLAATAVNHDLYLVTRNTQDVRASSAALFNPWEDDPSRALLSPRPRQPR